MDECINKLDKTLGDKVNTIIVTAPRRGIFYCTASGYTVIPRIVEPGDNDMIACRHHGLIHVAAGDIVGVVVPIDEIKAGDDIGSNKRTGARSRGLQKSGTEA